MTAGKENFQPGQEINWKKELRGTELYNLQFSYVLPKDPQSVERYVSAAVYQTLKGIKLMDSGIKDLLQNAPDAEDRMKNYLLIDSGRELVGYSREQAEAVFQGKMAKEAIDKDGDFGIKYGLWSDIFPVDSPIRLDPIKNFPGYLMLTTKLPEISGIKGFPDVLLSREVLYWELPENISSVHELAQKAAVKLGVNFPYFLQSVFDKDEGIFIEAMNSSGHKQMDKVRKNIVYSGIEGFERYTPQEKFKMLSRKERKETLKPAVRELTGRVTSEIGSGDSRADLSLDIVWVDGKVWYNPRKQRNDGEITPSLGDCLDLRIKPIITPHTTHQDLLDIRRKGKILLQDLGVYIEY